MAVTFEEYIMRKVPSWFQGPVGSAMLEAIGKQQDNCLDMFRQAIMCRFIFMCPDDALKYIGAERNMEQYPNESLDDYRYRLWASWQAWRYAGTDKGITDQIKYAFNIENVSIRTNAQWDPAPPDGNTEWWSRFWVVIDQPHPWTVYRWGEGEWGDGRRWGCDITVDQRELLKRIIRKWKASHAYCEAIIIKFDGYELKYKVKE